MSQSVLNTERSFSEHSNRESIFRYIVHITIYNIAIAVHWIETYSEYFDTSMPFQWTIWPTLESIQLPQVCTDYIKAVVMKQLYGCTHQTGNHMNSTPSLTFTFQFLPSLKTLFTKRRVVLANKVITTAVHSFRPHPPPFLNISLYLLETKKENSALIFPFKRCNPKQVEVLWKSLNSCQQLHLEIYQMSPIGGKLSTKPYLWLFSNPHVHKLRKCLSAAGMCLCKYCWRSNMMFVNMVSTGYWCVNVWLN